jgi:ABC-type sugar transport system, periplasmic component
MKEFGMLIFVMILSLIIIGCSENSNSQNDNVTTKADDTDVTTEETSEEFLDNLPADLDFGGNSVAFLVREEQAWKDEIAVEEENGEIINDSIYYRNRNVSERLNVDIVEIERLYSNDFIGAVRADVLADAGEYDIIAGYQYFMMGIVPEGIFHNIYDLPYVDVDAVYWTKNISEMSTVNGKMYAITGDLSLSLLEEVVVIFFNKNILNDNSLEDPYKIVTNGKWTIDKLEEMTANLYNDLNGNSIRDKEDIYGMVLANGNFVNQFARGFNISLIEVNNGVPEILLGSAKVNQFFDRMMSTLYNNINHVGEGDKANIVPTAHEDEQYMFTSDKILFMPATLSYTDAFRDMESNYGIIPLPKWDEQQEDYLTSSTDGCSMFFVPISSRDIEAASAVLEAMSALSATTVKHAYYEVVLKTKYSRDDISHAMLDLCTSGVIFDFAQLYSNALNNIGNCIKDYISSKSTAEFLPRRLLFFMFKHVTIRFVF